MKDSPIKKLGEVLDYEQPSKYIVASKNYSNDYKTPVLTAGKTFILGNTNEKENIFPADKLPVIIFDDFTTATQFVDFPFKVKSSAMKILHPKKDKADAKYLFYLMQTIKVDHATHKRFWISEYSEIEIPVPPVEDQRKIVVRLEKMLAKIKEAKKLRAEAQETTKNLLSAELHRIFEEGKVKGWEEKIVEDLIDTITPPVKIKKREFNQIGKYPIIDQSQNKIAGWTNNLGSLVKINTPVIIFGDHTCVVKYTDKSFAQGADGIKILVTKEMLLPRFFYLVLKNQPIKVEGYRRHFVKLKESKILLPPIGEQKKIVARLDALSEKIKKLQEYQAQTQSDLISLEKSILNQTFIN